MLSAFNRSSLIRSAFCFGVVLPIALTSIGCGPKSETTDSRIYRVTPSDLVRAYEDTPNKSVWNEKTVSVTLAPSTEITREGYRVESGELHWYTAFEDTPPAIVFHVSNPEDLTGISGTVEIIGICRGAVRDGVRRGSSVRWFVEVQSCRVVSAK